MAVDRPSRHTISAQRLSASTKETFDVKQAIFTGLIECSTPFGINEGNIGVESSYLKKLDECSTPFGINEGNMQPMVVKQGSTLRCSTPFGINEGNIVP